MSKIKIQFPRVEVTASLLDTETSRALLAALPCESRASTWGEEVYFALPVKAKLEPGATQVVDAGTVCFWVEGSSLALPFGPTPISEAEECRLVTAVNILGKIEGDAQALLRVHAGDKVKVSLVAN